LRLAQLILATNAPMPAQDEPAPGEPRSIRKAAEKLLAQLEGLQTRAPSRDLETPIEELKRLLRTLPPDED